MSILIKGMDMPKNCGECPFGKCESCHINLMIYGHDSANCPLVEVKPHGDLIDRRKLPLAFIDITDLPVDRCLPVYLKEDVDSAPIVVESEE